MRRRRTGELGDQNQLIFSARRSERRVSEIERAPENQLPLNQPVLGSSPRGLTSKSSSNSERPFQSGAVVLVFDSHVDSQAPVECPNDRSNQERSFWCLTATLTAKLLLSAVRDLNSDAIVVARLAVPCRSL